MGKTNNNDENMNKSSYYYGKNYEGHVLRDNVMLSKYWFSIHFSICFINKYFKYIIAQYLS